MGLDLANFDERSRNAVKLFWGNRESALAKQVESGNVDAGSRGAVTAGKNMDGFLNVIRELVERNGLNKEDIYISGDNLTLPGFFRPTKKWDLIVLRDGHLVAALEFKSQVGSIGNNFNNRVEEAIGMAHDLWTAWKEGVFGPDSPRPFLGWLMLMEDNEEAHIPRKNKEPHFCVGPEFVGTSYARRYELFCQKLVRENLFTSAAFLTSPKSAAIDGSFNCYSEQTSLKRFVSEFAGRIASVAAESSRLN